MLLVRVHGARQSEPPRGSRAVHGSVHWSRRLEAGVQRTLRRLYTAYIHTTRVPPASQRAIYAAVVLSVCPSVARTVRRRCAT